jgi:hypothetical protein
MAYAGRIIVMVGLAVGYYSALGYTKAFATGYAAATSRID